MNLNETVRNYIDQSVLCWLATSSTSGIPNVSPKELFTYTDEGQILIANIASPTTLKNLRENSEVCLSFVEIFVQKGFKLQGKARLVKKTDTGFEERVAKLRAMAGEAFPVNSFLEMEVEKVDEIIAPRYRFYPETKEEDQIESAYSAYGVTPPETPRTTGARAQFEYYKMLGDRTFAQLKEEDLFWQFNPESNSIAIIVKHLWGNMLSRWTDFLNTDGEKPWRKRDEEFEATIQSKAEFLEKWEEGWQVLFTALDAVTTENARQVIYIRNMGHSITEAVNRQLAHYAYHIGQIVFIGRMLRGADWQSLSVPKGGSKAYNAEKFAQPKRREHFTKGFLNG